MNYLSEEQLAVYCPAERFLSQFSDKEQRTIKSALKILETGFKKGLKFDSPMAAKEYLRLKLAGLKQEIFGVILLNSQNELIADEVMFVGTLNQTSIYPREVTKFALDKLANSCIFYHNHPSVHVKPSRADEQLTQTLKTAFQLFDIKVLDHMIVSDIDIHSMAESGTI